MAATFSVDIGTYGFAFLACVVCFNYILAAWLTHGLFRDTFSLRSLTRLQYMRLKQRAGASALEQMLAGSGYPFGVTAWKLQCFRYGICLLWILNSGYDIVRHSGAVSLPFLLLKLWGPAVWLLVTNTKASLVTFLLAKWRDVYDGEKNRELFMVYNMITDELRSNHSHRLNLFSLLSKLKDYTVRIKPALMKGLRRFDEGPHAAMELIAEEIDTKEAKELCKLLADLDTTPAEEIAVLVDAREESYTHMLRENQRRRRRLFGHFAYAIAFSPLLIYLWNALSIAQRYVTDLAKNTNHFG
ncbi:hypothetical protein [Paenibacillus silviterrae]|uniref:hypothetical protein n=1 Tax=Paenibacillus silviterrae TaxID=3242194 RepID=UPI002543A627|nr:hypothetical protein [Paenibacillus chinjuensis]